MLTEADMKPLLDALDREVKMLPKRNLGFAREQRWHVAVDGLPRVLGRAVMAKAVAEWSCGGNGIGIVAHASTDNTVDGAAAEMKRQWLSAIEADAQPQ